MFTQTLSVTITLPQWISSLEIEPTYDSVESQMALAIELSRLNVQHQTGGPFAAALFRANDNDWTLISIGVNRVVPQTSSVLHGETMALIFGQKRLGSFDLSCGGKCRLVTTGQPCIQCFGNIWWSGITSLAVAARASDIESIVGFKEGPVPRDWKKRLLGAPVPVTVEVDVLRAEACAVLKQYAFNGGDVYNAGSARPT